MKPGWVLLLLFLFPFGFLHEEHGTIPVPVSMCRGYFNFAGNKAFLFCQRPTGCSWYCGFPFLSVRPVDRKIALLRLATLLFAGFSCFWKRSLKIWIACAISLSSLCLNNYARIAGFCRPVKSINTIFPNWELSFEPSFLLQHGLNFNSLKSQL